MKKVSDVLRAKGNQVWSIDPEATVYRALEVMADKGVGALLVISNGDVVGVLSERDYTRKVILKGRSSETTPIKDIMTTRVLYARPDHNIEECMTIMTEKRARHLPVMADDELVGVISIGDCVKTIIEDQRSTIEQLERYISG